MRTTILDEEDRKQLPATADDESGDGVGGQSSRLRGITALMCSVLRGANRYSWLDREVYNQTLILHQTLLDVGGAESLTLEFPAEGFRLGSEEVTELPRAMRQLHGMVRRKGIRAIRFEPEVTAREIMELLRLLQTKLELVTVEERERMPNVILESVHGHGSIQIPEVQTQSRAGGSLQEGEKATDEVKGMVSDITKAIDAISVHSGLPQPGEGDATSTLRELAGNIGSQEIITLCLASLRRHDPYTYDHSINVGLVSIAMAKFLGWQGRDLEEFGQAALIHDLGKLYTPLEVLNKKGRFTPYEWSIMKRHPADGAEIIREAGVSNPLAPAIALEHHTNFDGTGYPVLGHSDIHPGSRIVQIADVYDAFTTIRPYRSQARPYEVLKMLRKQAGSQFDPELIEAFVEMMGVYPIGSVVKLQHAGIGLVVESQPECPDRPIVRILQDERGRRPRKTRLVDLSQRDPDSGDYLENVVECIDPVIRNIPIGRYI